MSETTLFNQYLVTRMTEVGVDQLTLARELGYRTPTSVGMWCSGQKLPYADILPAMAVVLKVAPVDLGIIWLASKCRELEGPLRREVLEPRGVNIPPQL